MPHSQAPTQGISGELRICLPLSGALPWGAHGEAGQTPRARKPGHARLIAGGPTCGVRACGPAVDTAALTPAPCMWLWTNSLVCPGDCWHARCIPLQFWNLCHLSQSLESEPTMAYSLWAAGRSLVTGVRREEAAWLPWPGWGRGCRTPTPKHQEVVVVAEPQRGALRGPCGLTFRARGSRGPADSEQPLGNTQRL